MQLGQAAAVGVGHEQVNRSERVAQLALEALAQLLETLAGGAADQHRLGMAQPQLGSLVGVEQVDLVEHQQPGPIAGADLLERLLDRLLHDRPLLLGRRAVEHVGQQLRAAGLLERRAEGVDQLVGKLGDEADRVGHQVRACRRA